MFSLNTGNNIGDEGTIELAEVLKLNTSLTALNLGGNRLIDYFVLIQYSESYW
jgi:hypothetical protein